MPQNLTRQSNAAYEAFPLLLLVLLLYVAIRYLAPVITPGYWAEVGGMDQYLIKTGFAVPMFSGDSWFFSIGDFITTLGLVFLFIELVKSSSSAAPTLVNHAFSMLTFMLALVLFIVAPGFTNSVFFMLMLMLLLDVMAGFIITTVSARRDLEVASVR